MKLFTMIVHAHWKFTVCPIKGTPGLNELTDATNSESFISSSLTEINIRLAGIRVCLDRQKGLYVIMKV